MSDGSKIEWTDATWNPITGCSLVSEGCRNCYAAALAAGRLRNHPSRAGLARRNADGVAKFTGDVRLNEEWLDQPLRWMRPRKIFVCAHGDLFHDHVPAEWIDKVFAVMALCPQHTFQVLTKRPENMRAYLDAEERSYGRILDQATQLPISNPCSTLVGDGEGNIDGFSDWPLPNVWLGTSVEDQATADERIPLLLDTPAVKRFISAEPLLGAIDLTMIPIGGRIGDDVCLCASALEVPDMQSGTRLDWVIVGGESGPNARAMHPDWVRSLRDQCAAAGVPFFFKQWGKWAPQEDDFGVHPDACYDRDGKPIFPTCVVSLSGVVEECPPYGAQSNFMVACGKKAAGHLLDGREHREAPE